MSEINQISQEGTVKHTSLQFMKAEEIIPIHIFRYNRMINLLINTKDIEESEVDGEVITWDDFWKARNTKIRAYLDCIQTLTQKEELLQFHNKEFTVEWNLEETVEIKEKVSRPDFSKLSFDEKVELLELMKKAKLDENNLPAVIQTNEETKTDTVDVNHEVTDEVNITSIKHENVQEAFKASVQTDPKARLQEAIMKIAAKKLSQAGANLDENERRLIQEN